MLEVAKFINHIGESIYFGENGIYLNYSDLHDYSWDYQSDNDKISFFERGIVSKSVPVVVACDNYVKGLNAINALMELTEKDLLAKEAGKLYVGDYYLKCYIKGSSKADYLAKKGYLIATLEIISDSPAWVKETVFNFDKNQEGSSAEGSGGDLDYNVDFPYDYTSSLSSRLINNPGFVGSDFKLVINGLCEDPQIFVSDNEYTINCKVEQGDKLVIDSKKKSITLVKRDGTEENYFKYRDKEHYIFEPIPSGINLVTWQGEYTFSFTLYEERSEPKWT